MPLLPPPPPPRPATKPSRRLSSPRDQPARPSPLLTADDVKAWASRLLARRLRGES